MKLKFIILPFFLIFVYSGILKSGNDSLVFISAFGDFQKAVSVSTAREEFIFVSDIQTNKIHKLSALGSEIASFGGPGQGDNELNMPYSIDATNGLDVIAADYLNNRIKRLDMNLNFIMSFSFYNYNLTAESSKKIFNPSGVTTLTSGDLFILCDATNYKAAKINDYSEVSLVFGNSNLGAEKMEEPAKIVKGNELDIWILDKGSNNILNFNNFGIFLKKLTPPEKSPVISIAYFNDNLFILHKSGLMIYDLKKGQYSDFYLYPYIKNLKDIALLDKSTVLLLSLNMIYKYSIN